MFPILNTCLLYLSLLSLQIFFYKLFELDFSVSVKYQLILVELYKHQLNIKLVLVKQQIFFRVGSNWFGITA